MAQRGGQPIDPSLDGPRASPIASISLGAERRFGFRLKAAKSAWAEESMRLGHGSLLVMENACQFIYQHSLLPEADGEGDAEPMGATRINLTFRCKQKLTAQPAPYPRSGEASGSELAPWQSAEHVFVGLTPGVEHCPAGWKEMLLHPFETPFVGDVASVAAARYRVWLRAQPIFLRWICSQLARRTLCGGSTPIDQEHASNLADIVREECAKDASSWTATTHDHVPASMRSWPAIASYRYWSSVKCVLSVSTL